MKAVKTEKKRPAVKVKPSAGIAEKLECEIASDRDINLTVDKAYQFLELETFQGERQVNDRHVQALYNAFTSGRFMWEHVIIALAKCEGKVYRINGQHTCWMRVNAPKDLEVKVREIVYAVKDDAALRALYSTFDQNKSRSAGHIAKALLVGTPVTADIWPSLVGHLSSSLRMWLYPKGADATEITVADVAEIVSFKYPDLFKQVGIFYQSKVYDNYIPGRRKAVVAAMFATFNAGPQKAYDFWTPVFDAIGFGSKDDARYRLRMFMDTHTQSSSRKLGVSGIGDEDMYRVCISAWNRWRKGEPVSLLKTTDKRVKPI